MLGKPADFIGLLGAVVGLAGLAVIVANPRVVGEFFGGFSQLIGTATSPAGGRLQRR